MQTIPEEVGHGLINQSDSYTCCLDKDDAISPIITVPSNKY